MEQAPDSGKYTPEIPEKSFRFPVRPCAKSRPRVLLKDGLDIAKCIALGATLGGMAGQFLKVAAISTEKTVEMMKLTRRQIEVTMQMVSAGNLIQLDRKLMT